MRRRSTLPRILGVSLAILLATLGLATPASANDFPVTRMDDPAPNGCAPTDCSLREAVIAANGSGNDCNSVSVPPGTYVLSRTGPGEDQAATGDLDLRDGECGAHLQGTDARTTIIDGSDIDRVFENFGGNSEISGVTIQNGTSAAGGGGIRNTTGSLNLTDVTVRNNVAATGGGGIENLAGRSVNVTHSTIGPGNSADEGGGIWSAGFLTLDDTTISGNNADVEGGGLYTGGGTQAGLDSLTITSNTAPSGGGIFDDASGSVQPIDTIVANNAGGDCNAGNGITTNGYNLDSDDSCNFDQDSDLHDDPLLAALANNGGPTDTHALTSGSPAVDSGSPSGGPTIGCLGNDQRGVSRPQGAGCDRGAFELARQGFGGRVTQRATGAPLENAEVDACPEDNSPCTVVFTDADGRYFGQADPGTYDLTARPPVTDPGSPDLPIEFAGLVLVSGQTSVHDFELGPPAPPPPLTTVQPNRGGPMPAVFWGSPFELKTEGACPGGIASYKIVQGFAELESGPMAEGPAGTYKANVPPLAPDHGFAKVQITIDCPSPPDVFSEFDIYIDPSGTVRTIAGEGGAPIAGATVTLFHSTSGTDAGPFEPVPSGSGIMSPNNRTNPDMTDAAGHFGWDVAQGFYKVRAEKDGCTAENGDPFVETGVLEIPPPVVNIDLRLSCGGEGGPSDAAVEDVKVHGKVKSKDKGHTDVDADVCNVGPGAFVVEPTDVSLDVLVNGTPTQGDVTLKEPKKAKRLKPGKCTKFKFRWEHAGDDLNKGDTVEFIVTVSGVDPPDGNHANDSSSATTTVEK